MILTAGGWHFSTFSLRSVVRMMVMPLTVAYPESLQGGAEVHTSHFFPL